MLDSLLTVVLCVSVKSSPCILQRGEPHEDLRNGPVIRHWMIVTVHLFLKEMNWNLDLIFVDLLSIVKNNLRMFIAALWRKWEWWKFKIKINISRLNWCLLQLKYLKFTAKFVFSRKLCYIHNEICTWIGK